MLFCSSVATVGSAITVGAMASLMVRRSTAARCTRVKTSAVINAVTAANNTNCLPDTRYISKPSFARPPGPKSPNFPNYHRVARLSNQHKDCETASQGEVPRSGADITPKLPDSTSPRTPSSEFRTRRTRPPAEGVTCLTTDERQDALLASQTAGLRLLKTLRMRTTTAATSSR